jgi:hypothetical protein
MHRPNLFALLRRIGIPPVDDQQKDQIVAKLQRGRLASNQPPKLPFLLRNLGPISLFVCHDPTHLLDPSRHNPRTSGPSRQSEEKGR